MASRPLYASEAGGKWATASVWGEVSPAGAENALKTVPTAEDDVIFGEKSGSVQIEAAAKCRSLTCNAKCKATVTLAVELVVGFSTEAPSKLAFSFGPEMTFTLTAGIFIKFVGTSKVE